MNREEAENAMNKLLEEATARTSDRNVGMLNVASRALQGQGMLPKVQQIPGTRPYDGGVAPQEQSPVDIVRRAMIDARRIVDNFEKSTIELESKVAQLEAQLDAERDARQSLERMLTEITELVSSR